MDGSYGVSIEFTHGAGSMELAKMLIPTCRQGNRGRKAQ